MQTLLHAAAVGVALALGVDPGRAQSDEQLSKLTPEQLAIVRQLGPDGFQSSLPLSALVESTAAAVVGRVLGIDGFDHSSGYAAVAYRVAIDDVLFSRTVEGSPTLVSGTVVRFEQRGKGDFARDYFTGKLPPVDAADTCLLFLGAAPSGVRLLGWMVQFRRAPGTPPTAETFGPASLAAEMAKPHWFGPNVRMVETPRGASPEWGALVAEVRRLGPLPGRQR
jgi:hypothetical protein